MLKLSFRVFLIQILILVTVEGFSQTTGDYRTTIAFAIEDWSDLSIWERYNGSAWVTPTGGQGYPGQFSTPTNVTVSYFIGSLTLDVNPANSLNNFTLNGFVGGFNSSLNNNLTFNGTLNIGATTAITFGGNGNFIVNGATQVSGTFTDSNGTGTTRFVGAITVTGTFESSTVTTAANMNFRGGIANTGTFNAGGALFNTSNQAITGNSALTFNNDVQITSVLLTCSNTSSLTINGTTTLSGSGGFTDTSNGGITLFVGNVNVGANTAFTTTAVTTTGNLVFRGGITNNGTSFSAGGATFNTNAQAITGATAMSFANSVAIASSVTYSITNNLTISGTTTLSNGAFSDPNNTGVDTFGNITLSGTSTFNTTATTTTSNLIIQGGITNNGSAFAAGGATFNTNAQAITGSTAISFGNNVLISGIVVTSSNTNNLTISGTTTLTNGGFTDSNNNGVDTFIGNVSQTGTSAFNTTATTTTSNLIFRGGITNSGGTFSAGGATFNTNSQALDGTLSFGSIVTVTGVTVTNNGTVSMTSTGTATLAGTGTWTQAATGTLNYAGATLTVNTFNADNAGNTVSYNSSAAQTVRTPSATYSNLTFDNSFGTSPQLTLTNDITVASTLTMLDGNLNLNGNDFTIGTGATNPLRGALSHSGNSTSGYMYGGSLIRYMSNNATTIGSGDENEGFFPLGTDAGDYRPLYIGKPSGGGSGGIITLTHTNSTNTSVVSIADTGPVATITLRHDSFWTVATSGIGGTGWSLRAGGTNFGTIGAVTDLRMATSSGVVGTHSAGTGVPATAFVNRTALTSAEVANNFHVSSTDAINSPLPVELLSFTAHVSNDVVKLNWATVSELNNEFFTIERSPDAESFEQVLTKEGNGTTNDVHEYEALDDSPIIGRSYYRLKQTDFDGTFSYSDLVSVDYAGPAFATLRAAPNPSTGSELTLQLKGVKEERDVPVRIVSLQGELVFEGILHVDASGKATHEIIFREPLASGIYIVKAGPSVYLTQKVAVIR